MVLLSLITLTLNALARQDAQMDPPAPAQLAPITPGPFSPSLDSLKQNRYPEWFTRGKLGIWAHWGPQSVPMDGDWYARNEYIQGSEQYQDHLSRYGHPSVKGYKDIIPLWKAEKWDPARLMAKYKKAGAHYFVSMGVHHDNFDLWNSTYHRWNAVKMGPHRDIVGTWQKEAKKLGLHFGVSEHLGASFTWFQKSRGHDATGPLAGVPYDGNDPRYTDLYHEAALPGDTGWYSTDPRWHAQWYRRIKDLIDQYHPDLLYSDGGIPFGEVGEQLVAHFYNQDIARHNGKQTVVYTCKQPSEGRWTQDVERGVLSGIQPYPWQTDTSIGDWFYNKHWKYRDAAWVLHTLIDVVSKNGNLLINVVQRPDGSLDPEAEKVLDDMAGWMSVNGESIFDTTPWVVYGEGPERPKGGAFKEDFDFTSRDVRYSQKGEHTVYATLMGKPSSDEIVLAAMGRGAAVVRSVSLLGSRTKPMWQEEEDGLHVTLPSGAPMSDIAVVLKISGTNLHGFRPLPPPTSPPAVVVNASENGDYMLGAALAQTHGDGIQVEDRSGTSNLGFWDSASDFASWSVRFSSTGTYGVIVNAGTQNLATPIVVSVGDQKLSGTVPSTGSWDAFSDVSLGTVRITSEGLQEVTVKPASAGSWHAINLRSVRFRKVQGPETLSSLP